MSKNLSKATSWLQRQIEELKAGQNQLLDDAYMKSKKAAAIGQQIAELQEVIDKIPSNGLQPKE